MTLHSSCFAGDCDNHKWFPNKMIKHRNVQGDIKIHKLPVSKERKRAWIAKVSKGRKGFQPSKNHL